MNSKRRFTLVELVVVTGVIAILAGLLLPALNSEMTRAAKLTLCAGNIKQLGAGIIKYGADNQGFVLPKEAGTKSSIGRTDKNMMGPQAKSWNMFIAPYIDMKLGAIADKGRNTTVPAQYRKGIMKCPASTCDVMIFSYIQYGMPKYNIGGEVYTDDLVPLKKFSDAKLPAQMALLLDSAYHAPAASTAVDNKAPDTVGQFTVDADGRHVSRKRHEGRTNICMLDGHVEMMTEKVLSQKVAKQQTYAHLKSNVLMAFGGNKKLKK